ncbi:MAG: hypothetical protein RDA78_28510 [Roseibium sp.]|uniref:hypothetical protein n=1 Tax=Roseibium sp. TaxID=1936156 RepID=UPI003D9C0AC3
MRRRQINFERISTATLLCSEVLVERWLPDGKREGAEWVARNPRRNDHKPGSLKINLQSGKWADFATGEGGRDLVALAAYLFDLSQPDAGLKVAKMLGIHAHDD